MADATYNQTAVLAIAAAAYEWMESTGGAVALFLGKATAEIMGIPDKEDRCPDCGKRRHFTVVVDDLYPGDDDLEIVAGQVLATMRQARETMDGRPGPCCN